MFKSSKFTLSITFSEYSVILFLIPPLHYTHTTPTSAAFSASVTTLKEQEKKKFRLNEETIWRQKAKEWYVQSDKKKHVTPRRIKDENTVMVP